MSHNRLHRHIRTHKRILHLVRLLSMLAWHPQVFLQAERVLVQAKLCLEQVFEAELQARQYPVQVLEVWLQAVGYP